LSSPQEGKARAAVKRLAQRTVFLVFISKIGKIVNCDKGFLPIHYGWERKNRQFGGKGRVLFRSFTVVKSFKRA
jgi:hypothetical protein